MSSELLLASGSKSSFTQGSKKKKRRTAEDFKETLWTYSRCEKNMNHLPHVTVADILLRLSIESVLASTLVWPKLNEVTQDSEFVKSQLARSPTGLILQPSSPATAGHLGYLKTEGESNVFRKIPLSEKLSRDFKVMCSLDGLVCMAPARDWRADPLYLYNPITRVCMELPKSGSKHLLSHYVVCLGKDANERYHIIRHYTYANGARETRFEILSLGQSSWQRLYVHRHNWCARKAIFYKGVFFIITKTKQFRDYEIRVTAMDVHGENVQIIPDVLKGRRIHPSVLEILEGDNGLIIITIDHKISKSTYEFKGNKVGEFSVDHLCTFGHYPGWLTTGFHFQEETYMLKGNMMLKQESWNSNFLLCSTNKMTKYNPQSIGYKAFGYKPSFVNPITEAEAARYSLLVG